MCGISGFIGESSYPELSNSIIDNLFKHLELRGKDASGFWGCDKKNNIFYHKEPVKSGLFVDNACWKKVMEDYSPNMLLVHARASSPTSGAARINKNNHPFISSNKKIGAIHNGVLYESPQLKKLYEINSTTDSELLLRIFESNPDRFESIRTIFSCINKGHMAVAIGEKMGAEDTDLYLFRNEYRPMCIVDLRELVNQIFFVSSREVWDAAIGNTDYKCDLIELPVHELWHITNRSGKLDIGRYKAIASPLVELDLKEFTQLKINEEKAGDEIIISDLKKDDEVNYVKKYPNNFSGHQGVAYSYSPPVSKTNYVYPDDDNSGFNIVDDSNKGDFVGQVESYIKEIKSVLDDIQVDASNNYNEGNLTNEKIIELIDSLKNTKIDVKGTLAVLNNSLDRNSGHPGYGYDY